MEIFKDRIKKLAGTLTNRSGFPLPENPSGKVDIFGRSKLTFKFVSLGVTTFIKYLSNFRASSALTNFSASR